MARLGPGQRPPDASTVPASPASATELHITATLPSSPCTTIHLCLLQPEGRASAQHAQHPVQEEFVWPRHPSSTHFWPDPQRHWLTLRLLDSKATVLHSSRNPGSSGVVCMGRGSMRLGELTCCWTHALHSPPCLTALSTWVPHSQAGSFLVMSNWLISSWSYGQPGNAPPCMLSPSLFPSPLTLAAGKSPPCNLSSNSITQETWTRVVLKLTGTINCPASCSYPFCAEVNSNNQK